MDMALFFAGAICVGLAFGHATMGLVWVLPGMTAEHMPRTPFGSPGATEGMIRITWHIVTVFAFCSGGLLLTLAWSADPDPRSILLRWFAVMWIAASAMAFYVVRPHPRQVARRMPVPLLWVVVAVLCWMASV